VFSKRAEHPFVKRIVIVKMIAAYPEPASFERVALDVITSVIIFWEAANIRRQGAIDGDDDQAPPDR
jgi:hypothetical protein